MIVEYLTTISDRSNQYYSLAKTSRKAFCIFRDDNHHYLGVIDMIKQQYHDYLLYKVSKFLLLEMPSDAHKNTKIHNTAIFLH